MKKDDDFLRRFSTLLGIESKKHEELLLDPKADASICAIVVDAGLPCSVELVKLHRLAAIHGRDTRDIVIAMTEKDEDDDSRT